MPYILKRYTQDFFKVMKVSESRKYKGYCSWNCPSCYTKYGEVFCAPYGDTIDKRYEECYEDQKPIDFLLKN